MLLGKHFRYNLVVDLIEKIGYKQRTGNYYIIREEDGYINISYWEDFDTKTIKISFHKNYYIPYQKEKISLMFDNFKSFFDFISIYHNKLFLKYKIEKLKKNINESWKN